VAHCVLGRVSGIFPGMNDEAEHLERLVEACDLVLPRLESGECQMDDHLADAFRERCRGVERRLAELKAPALTASA
jgi:hypothetical protein